MDVKKISEKDAKTLLSNEALLDQHVTADEYAQTVSYAEIAHRIALERGLKSMSAQAVGGAVGHNPISLIIPCHRVIGKDGSLTGYAAGLERKRWLLALEMGENNSF